MNLKLNLVCRFRAFLHLGKVDHSMRLNISVHFVHFDEAEILLFAEVSWKHLRTL